MLKNINFKKETVNNFTYSDRKNTTGLTSNIGVKPVAYKLSTSTQLNGVFKSIFYRYFSFKNTSVVGTMQGFLKENYRKNLCLKNTRLIKSRYLVIIFLFFFFQPFQTTFAQSILNQRIDFSVENTSIENCITRLSELVKVDIAFSNRFFKNNQKITLNLQNEPVQNVLKKILEHTNITYKTLDSQIFLLRKKNIFFTISGYLEDEETGERLISATVYCPKLQKGITTNEYGFYSLSLPVGEVDLQYNYLGYREKKQKLILDKNIRQTVTLSPSLTLMEVIVEPKREEQELLSVNDRKVLDITPSLIASSPGLGGEEDPVRALEMLPGVHSGVDGMKGLHVRGGNGGQSLMMLDGVPIYIPYHLLGAYSIYNSSILRSTKLLRGNFSARYGGRLSSILDVRTREGNQYNWHAEASANLTTAKVLLEGPLKKEKGAVLLAGRMSHSGFLLNPIFERTYFPTINGEIKTNFYDFNIKVNYVLTAKDRIYLSLYNGKDVFSGDDVFEDEGVSAEYEVKLNWGNTTSALRWNHLFNSKLFSNMTLTYSRFGYESSSYSSFIVNFEEEFDEIDYINSRSNNQDLGVKLDFDYLPNTQHTFRFGTGLSLREFVPDITTFDEDDEELFDLDSIDLNILEDLVESEKIKVTEMYAYLEDQISLGDWQFILGLRASSFLGEDRSFFNIEPRLALNYQLNPKLSFNLSASRMVQYLHLLSNNALRLPNDIWLPSSNDILPQKSWQTELNLNYYWNKKLNFSLSAYSKWMENLYTYPEEYSVFNIFYEEEFDVNEFDTDLVRGSGKAYGIEFMSTYFGEKNGLLFSYTLSKSTRQYDKLNLGKVFPHAFDQRHQINLFVYQKLGKHFQVGCNWTYYSSPPKLSIYNIDVTSGVATGNFDLPGKKNKSRALAYHRLDINLSYLLKTGKIQHRFKIGAYNIYNRFNVSHYLSDPFSQGPNFEVKSTPVKSVPFLPSVYYSISF